MLKLTRLIVFFCFRFVFRDRSSKMTKTPKDSAYLFTYIHIVSIHSVYDTQTRFYIDDI